MGRINDTKKTIKLLCDGLDKNSNEAVLCLLPLLSEIAISLAVLAENVQGQIDQREALKNLFTGTK